MPGDIVQAVSNITTTSVRMGQYDQAVTQYMRALDSWRSLIDNHGAAVPSYTLGLMFGQQRRFGAAVSSMQSAFNTFQQLKEKTTDMADVTGAYGEALVLASRGGEAMSYLNDALKLSRELQGDAMVSQTLIYQVMRLTTPAITKLRARYTSKDWRPPRRAKSLNGYCGLKGAWHELSRGKAPRSRPSPA